LDLFSRRVVGWAVADAMPTSLCLDALNMAVAERHPDAGVIHHSDRGSQYASDSYQETLANYKMICSMSRKGNCWDNSVVESFFGSLKDELIYRHTWPTQAAAATAIENYICKFYNSRRRHSTLGNISPMEYEMISRRQLAA